MNFALVLVTKIFYKKVFLISVNGMARFTGARREAGVSALAAGFPDLLTAAEKPCACNEIICTGAFLTGAN